MTEVEAGIPPAVPDTYDPIRCQGLWLLFRLHAAQEVLEKLLASDWELPLREDEAETRHALIQAKDLALRIQTAHARKEVERLQYKLLPMQLARTKAFYKLHADRHLVLAQQHLKDYEQALEVYKVQTSAKLMV